MRCDLLCWAVICYLVMFCAVTRGAILHLKQSCTMQEEELLREASVRGGQVWVGGRQGQGGRRKETGKEREGEC